ncbi:MAG: hypothetical protein DI622_14110 [Chryseobacterium sp.]|nr:MAG: hypothetical protein DI622_14110 [Chryseobacterium sp.]
MKKPDISANEFYNHFIGTENYYRYPLGLLLTDGVKAVANEEKCYWLLDAIASYQFEEKFKNQEFQVWKIQRVEETKFKLSATDGNKKILVTQDIEYSDFFFSEFTIWKEGDVLLLPSEH